MPIVSSLGGEYGFGLQPQPRLATAIKMTPQVNRKSSHDFDLDGDFIIFGSNVDYMNPDTIYTITSNVNVTVGVMIWGGGGGGTPGYTRNGGAGGAVVGVMELIANKKYEFMIGAPGRGIDDLGVRQDQGSGGGAASFIRGFGETVPLAVAGGGGGASYNDVGHPGGRYKSPDVRYNGNVGIPATKGGDGLGNPAGGLGGQNGYGYGGGRGSLNFNSGGGGGGYPFGGLSGNTSVSENGGWGGTNFSNVSLFRTAWNTVSTQDLSAVFDLGFSSNELFGNEIGLTLSLPELWDRPKAQTQLLPTRITANTSANAFQYHEWNRSPSTMIHAGSSGTSPEWTVSQYGMIRIWTNEHVAVKFTSNLTTPASNKIIKEGSLVNEVGYQQIKFLSNGAFTISNPGINDTIEIICVGAGGNGNNANYIRNGGSGGDAGAITYQVVPAYAGTWTVKIGSSGAVRTDADKETYVQNPYGSLIAHAAGGREGSGSYNTGKFYAASKCQGLFINFYEDFFNERIGYPGNRGVSWTNTGGIDWAGTVTTFPSMGGGGGGSSQDAEPNTGSGGGGGIDYGEWGYDKPGGYLAGLGGSGTVYIRYCTRTGGGPNIYKPLGSTFFNSDGTILGNLYDKTTSQHYRVANTPWTIDFWVYLLEYNNRVTFFIEDSNISGQVVYLKWIRLVDKDGGGPGKRWSMSNYDERLSSDRQKAIVSQVDQELNTWTHVAFVYDGTVGPQHTKIYINGVDRTIPYNALGMQYPYPTGWPNRENNDHRIMLTPDYPCYVSNFRYKKSAIYTANFTPSTAQLSYDSDSILITGIDPFESREGFYLSSNAFVEGSSVVWNRWYMNNSSSGLGERALSKYLLGPERVVSTTFSPGQTVTESITYSAFFTPQSFATLTASAKSFASGAAFDMSADPYTVEFWIHPLRLPGTGNSCRLLRFGPNNSTSSFVLFQFSSTGAVTMGRPSTGSTLLSTSPDVVELNQWQHFAVILDNGTGRIYKNGSLLISGSVTMPTLANNACIIGYDSPGTVNFPYYGYLSNLRITKGEALYTEPTFTVPTEPFTADSYTANTVLAICGTSSLVDNSPGTKSIITTAGPAAGTAGHIRISRFGPFNP